MMDLIFATNNQHKVAEIQEAVQGKFQIITMSDAGITMDIPEPHDTLEKNASEKSRTIFRLTGKDTFGEDTGLEVDALSGEPGVKSARYAGEERDFQKNMDRLLKEMNLVDGRTARFRTVISLIYREKEYFFEGICEGLIEKESRGTNGFGYDAIFRPYGSVKTFAEMSMQEKGMFSHRKKATDKLVLFLQTADTPGNELETNTKL